MEQLFIQNYCGSISFPGKSLLTSKMMWTSSLLFLHIMIYIITGNALQYDVGRKVKSRKFIGDSLINSNLTIIGEPRRNAGMISKPGVIAKWRFFAQNAGLIFLQVWRPVSTARKEYFLVGQEEWYITRPTRRRYTIYGSHKIFVATGDILGFYIPGPPIIPYDGKACNYGRTLYLGGRTTLYLNQLNVYKFNETTAGIRACRKYSLKATVVTSSTMKHGEPVIHCYTVGDDRNTIYIVNPGDAIPVNGDITQWSFYTRISREVVYLQLWRKRGGNWYVLVGQTVDISISGRNIMNLPYRKMHIAVRKGDLLGLYFPGRVFIPYTAMTCSESYKPVLHAKTAGPITVGATRLFQMNKYRDVCRKYSLEVKITYYKLTSVVSGAGAMKHTYTKTFGISDGSRGPS